MKRTIMMAAFSLAACLALAPGVAWAESVQPEVVLKAGDKGVSAVIEKLGGVDDTRALELSFKVSVMTGNAKSVDFAFNEALSASVKQSRYDAGKELLTIYVAGAAQNLVSANGIVELGSVTAEAADDQGVSLSIEAAPSSLKMVSAARSGSAPSFYVAPDPVELKIGQGGVTPEPPTPPDPTDPPVPPTPDPGTGDNPGTGGDSTGAGSSAGMGSSAGRIPGSTGNVSLLNTGDPLAIAAVCLVAAAAGAGVLAFVARRRACRQS